MFTEEHRAKAWEQIRQHDLRAFAKILPGELLARAAAECGVGVARSPLNVVNLAWLAIAAALHTAQNFAGVLGLVLKLLQDAEGFAATPLGRRRRPARPRRRRAKHDPRRSRPTDLSEEAFAQARQRMPWSYWVALTLLLSDRFAQQYDGLVRWKQFRLLALDGTCVNLPSWKALAEHFGTAKNGRRRKTPQARLVMLQFPLTRVPYRYELAPLALAEKTLARRLLGHLQANDLVLVDRGFWSYGLFWEIQRQEAFFAIRLIRSARFRSLRRFSRDDRLVEHRPAEPRWRRQGFPESIRLRVIRYQMRGFRASTVVTNVLDPQLISRDEWVRLATEGQPGRHLDPGLYHRRWEIETTYMELKVRQGMEGSLRGRTPETIRYEIAGHVLLYTLVRWLMVEAATAHGQDPLRLSFLEALRELEVMSPTLVQASPERVARVLLPRLLARLASHRVPERPGRHYPRPGDTRVRNKGHGRLQRPHKLKRSITMLQKRR